MRFLQDLHRVDDEMAARLGMGVAEREALRDHAATLPPPPGGTMHLPALAASLLAHAPPDAVVHLCAHAGAVAASVGRRVGGPLHSPRTHGGVSQARPPPPSPFFPCPLPLSLFHPLSPCDSCAGAGPRAGALSRACAGQAGAQLLREASASTLQAVGALGGEAARELQRHARAGARYIGVPTEEATLNSLLWPLLKSLVLLVRVSPQPRPAPPALRPKLWTQRGRGAPSQTAGAGPPPSLLLPLPMSLLYTPSVDKDFA